MSLLYWILINLVLPLSPFLLRIFILFVGSEQNISIRRIGEIPEILFYSIFVCVICLNINMAGKNVVLEQLLRLLLSLILVLDFITLGMVYSGNMGPRTLAYSIVAAIVPAAIAPVYQLYYTRIGI